MGLEALLPKKMQPLTDHQIYKITNPSSNKPNHMSHCAKLQSLWHKAPNQWPDRLSHTLQGVGGSGVRIRVQCLHPDLCSSLKNHCSVPSEPHIIYVMYPSSTAPCCVWSIIWGIVCDLYLAWVSWDLPFPQTHYILIQDMLFTHQLLTFMLTAAAACCSC